ncbi:MAG: hypothetical protein AB1505_08055 [Candidatus Latescibacterota bacterium]
MLPACGRTDSRFASPAATFRTYQKAIAVQDLDLLWQCYARGYRESLPAGREGWAREWAGRSPAQRAAEVRRQIAEERLINQQIGYLLFDSATLPSRREPPFFYFVREQAGWKITTHLDTVFQHELEGAIQRGEYRLPER